MLLFPLHEAHEKDSSTAAGIIGHESTHSSCPLITRASGPSRGTTLSAQADSMYPDGVPNLPGIKVRRREACVCVGGRSLSCCCVRAAYVCVAEKNLCSVLMPSGGAISCLAIRRSKSFASHFSPVSRPGKASDTDARLCFCSRGSSAHPHNVADLSMSWSCCLPFFSHGRSQQTVVETEEEEELRAVREWQDDGRKGRVLLRRSEQAHQHLYGVCSTKARAQGRAPTVLWVGTWQSSRILDVSMTCMERTLENERTSARSWAALLARDPFRRAEGILYRCLGLVFEGRRL